MADLGFRAVLGVIPGPDVPIVIGIVGNPELRSEEFVQVEAGYRLRLGSLATLEATAFNGWYDDLRTVEPRAPIVELTPEPVHLFQANAFDNLLTARTSGVELNTHWTPQPQWEVDASYSFLHVTAHVDPTSLDAAAAEGDGNSPAHQWQVRSTFSPRPDLQIGGSVFRTGRLRQLDVAAYTRVDARIEFRLTPRLTLAGVGQNLLHGYQREFTAPNLSLSSRMPRSARVNLRWTR